MCVSVVIVDLLEFELLELERQRTEKTSSKKAVNAAGHLLVLVVDG